MAVNVVGLVAAAIAIAPAAVALYLVLGRYDGHFRDNVIFLFLMGGLFLGMLLALFQVYLLYYWSFAPGLAAAAMYLAGTPLLHHAAFTAILNRRKWQGERHAIWNGVALGAGAAVMIALGFSIRTVTELSTTSLLNLALVASAFTLFHVASGAYVGAGVLDRAPFRALLRASAAMLPLAFFTFEWYLSVARGEPGGTFWLALAAAYAALAFAWAQRAVVPRALTPDGRRQMRRDARRERSGGEQS